MENTKPDDPTGEKNQVIIYRAEDGSTQIEVEMTGETVWLSQKKMAELFGVDIRTVNEHLQNIFISGEIDKNSVIRKFRITANDGKTYETNFYNLDAIISVGYRVNSMRATQFRIWATKTLREYIVKGFVMDDERLANGGYKHGYFGEMLERVRKIRASERNLYEKVKDIFSTSTTKL